MDDDMRKTALAFFESIPHSKELGMRFTEFANGRAAMTMPYDPRLVGDPETGVIHGGAVSALLDTTCGAAVVAHDETSTTTATLDLRIDYMRPATPGQAIRAVATCYRVTRSVAFVRAEALDDNTGSPVATATGAFTAEKST